MVAGICAKHPKNKCTPNCSQHSFIFKLKCNSLSKTPQNIRNTPKHSEHGQNIRNTAKTFETPQNIRNTPKQSKHVPPQHSKHPDNIRTDTDTRTRRTDGQEKRAVMEKTGTYGKDMHLWKRRAIMEKTGIKHLKRDFYIVEII